MRPAVLTLLDHPTAGIVQPRRPATRDCRRSRQNLAASSERLKVEFPRYEALVRPEPLSVAHVQSLLREDEALILLVDTPVLLVDDPNWKPAPEETFIWVVTKDKSQWVRSGLGTSALQREVSALRCGLDYAGAWRRQDSKCRELTSNDYTSDDKRRGAPLPFDLARAHALYKSLFGEVDDLIKGKALLVVPSGPLTQLPFQVLVTAAPSPAKTGADAMRTAQWLIRDHAITVLPAVSSLVALRELAKQPVPRKPMVGFGNPLVDGPGPEYANRAQQARVITSCATQIAVDNSELRATPELPITSGHADITRIRTAVPLPETARELCTVAEDVGADAGDIYLGAKATVPNVIRLSEAGVLQQFSPRAFRNTWCFGRTPWWERRAGPASNTASDTD